MKLREIIEKIDKSHKNSCYISLSELAHSEFDIHNYLNEDESRITAYFFLNWQCTDTWVGGRAYFLDDKLIATSWQPARKSNEDFSWVSKELFNETRQYLLSLIEEPEISIDLIDLEQELNDGFPISYSSQLLVDDVIYKPTGELVKVSEKFRSMEKIDMWSKVKVKFDSNKEEIVDMSEILVPYNLKK